jgi:hypothetical protein
VHPRSATTPEGGGGSGLAFSRSRYHLRSALTSHPSRATFRLARPSFGGNINASVEAMRKKRVSQRCLLTLSRHPSHLPSSQRGHQSQLRESSSPATAPHGRVRTWHAASTNSATAHSGRGQLVGWGRSDTSSCQSRLHRQQPPTGACVPGTRRARTAPPRTAATPRRRRAASGAPRRRCWAGRGACCAARSCPAGPAGANTPPSLLAAWRSGATHQWRRDSAPGFC